MNKHTYKSGITLIETIIYIGLMSLVIYGSIFITYHMIEIGGKNEESVYILNEVVFINKKIEWILRDTTNVTITNNTLIVTKIEPSEDNPIILKQENNSIVLKRASEIANPLNNDRYKISDLIIDQDTSTHEILVKYKINNLQYTYKKQINR
jgi:hypothetical protein